MCFIKNATKQEDMYTKSKKNRLNLIAFLIKE